MIINRILPLLLLFGLIAAPDVAFAAASEAALLWWTRVLPSLLPYLIAASLLGRSDLFFRVPKRFQPFFLLLFGALGGYPVGAKLSARLCTLNVLSPGEAKKACACCNLPNPVFIISVVAIGFFADPRTAAPLLIGIYVPALFGLIPLSKLTYGDTAALPASGANLSDAIGDGVRSIAAILGCLVLASVLGALLEATGLFRAIAALLNLPETTVGAVSTGLFEMTCGVRKIALAAMPLQARLALSAFFLQLGGAAVLLQTASAFPISYARYLLVKLLYAICSAAIALALTPLFCPDTAVPTLASGAVMLRHTFDLASVLLASGFGLLLVFLFTFGLSKRKKGA